MRYYRIIAIFFFIVGCKTSSVVQQTGSYEENLSILRSKQTIATNDSLSNAEVKIIESNMIPAGHINAEIDSIHKIIIERNLSKKWDGFTIQVYSGTSRKDSQNAKATIDKLYPDLPSSMIYYRPSYRVKVGKYFDRLEATKIFNEMKITFPKAILLPEKFSLLEENE